MSKLKIGRRLRRRAWRGPRGLGMHRTSSILALSGSLLLVSATVPAVALAVVPPSLHGVTRRPALDRAVQFRLDRPLLDRLKRFETAVIDGGWVPISRSDMTRVALENFLRPITEVIERHVGSGWTPPWERSLDDSVSSFGPNTRVRLPSELIEQLDAVEAYARGLGHRHVTRSTLIRSAIDSFLSGAEEALAGEGSQGGARRAGDENGRAAR